VRYESHAHTPVKGAPGPARDGQIAVYGDNERIIPIGTTENGKVRNVHPDGFTSQYGAVGDYKHVTSADGSWYVPDSLPKDSLRELATDQMDRTLRKLQLAADKVMDGDGVVEITTNNPKAATWIESRMEALGIRGYVRITS
jgi:hypothetical protein